MLPSSALFTVASFPFSPHFITKIVTHISFKTLDLDEVMTGQKGSRDLDKISKRFHSFICDFLNFALKTFFCQK